MKNHLIGRTETKGITTMNESETIDPRELNPLALAFVGDSVLELLVRTRLARHHRMSAGKLNVEKVKYVSARAQFREEQLLEPLFTGFECLLGWLYLTGQMSRVEELFDALWQQFDPNQK